MNGHKLASTSGMKICTICKRDKRKGRRNKVYNRCLNRCT